MVSDQIFLLAAMKYLDTQNKCSEHVVEVVEILHHVVSVNIGLEIHVTAVLEHQQTHIIPVEIHVNGPVTVDTTKVEVAV